MKTIKLFGTTFINTPNSDLQSIKFSGFEYDKSEVLTALKIKGFEIRYIGPSNLECAIREGEQPSEMNVWYKVAREVLTVEKPNLK